MRASPPAAKLADLLSGRWTLAVLAELCERGSRYQELNDAFDGVSHKVLTDTLRRAERDGLIVLRVDLSRIGTATLYELSELGRSLDEPLAVIRKWENDNWSHVEAAWRGWVRRDS